MPDPMFDSLRQPAPVTPPDLSVIRRRGRQRTRRTAIAAVVGALALVAALGLLPAALATGVGTDTQRPFAVVIVGGLVTCLLIIIFLMPALYTIVARDRDRLEV